MVSAQTRTWHDEAGQSPIIKDVYSSLLKHVSDSPGLVDFAIGLVNSVFNFPDRQVRFFEEFE